ncbi:SLOG family protein [Halococcus thailandensis]|uniref:SLOG family protein n=1 Tax=Halococcus thailandensis TaxID=335952 RepID=UPI000677A17F|nr:SLOG family protein [Halococcus thailandensis]
MSATTANSENGLSVIVADSRSILDCLSPAGQRRLVVEAIDESGFSVAEVVSGTARGVDQLGEDWAGEHDVPVKRFPADWDTHGRAAGPIRNEEMAKYADALVAIHVDESAGTADMIDTARDLLGPDRLHRVPVTSGE